jgi:hypothetical protein
MSQQRMRFQRAPLPPSFRFQARDASILQVLHGYDGVLAKRQIKDLFWPQASLQAMERRLSLLFQAGYINMPSIEQRRINPIPEPIVWLDWKGILFIAAEIGLQAQEPKTINENQSRRIEKQMREAGLRWQREPRWSQLAHDIAVNDFRLAVEAAAKKWPSITLESWTPEGEFLSNMDVISLTGEGRQKGVRPDGFFVIQDHMRPINNSPAKARFLLELDFSTHPLARFGRDKAKPGLAYIRSQEYRERFGFNSGRWLVVCKSKTRLSNLKRQTEAVLGNQCKVFLFTTIDQVTPETVLTKPIWLKASTNEYVKLIENIGS